MAVSPMAEIRSNPGNLGNLGYELAVPGQCASRLAPVKRSALRGRRTLRSRFFRRIRGRDHRPGALAEVPLQVSKRNRRSSLARLVRRSAIPEIAAGNG